MKIHIGCGTTLLHGFVNIDNSPSGLLSKLPSPGVTLLHKLSLINGNQLELSRRLRKGKKEFLYCNCLHLPFGDGSVDFAYSSHMLGWCLGQQQLRQFAREVHRVLRPGGGMRVSFFDFDKVVAAYGQHRSTIQLMGQLPLGAEEFSFRRKLKLLISPNMQNGMPLNAETFGQYLEEQGFREIRVLKAGETGMERDWVEAIDLSERPSESIYMECRKAD
jgi:ubiquinone/menaquinone biosynthesis C-methylase UbiE